MWRRGRGERKRPERKRPKGKRRAEEAAGEEAGGEEARGEGILLSEGVRGRRGSLEGVRVESARELNLGSF